MLKWTENIERFTESVTPPMNAMLRKMHYTLEELAKETSANFEELDKYEQFMHQFDALDAQPSSEERKRLLRLISDVEMKISQIRTAYSLIEECIHRTRLPVLELTHDWSFHGRDSR